MKWTPAICCTLLLTSLALAEPPAMIPLRKDVKPFEYVEANVPFYPPGERWGTTADPIKKMQKPLDPAESLKHYVHPVGFDLKLFVAEDQLGGKPIAMSWDERGRLWVSLTRDYPNELQREGQGRDRIVICEDTDGDWRADKVTTFADKLSIPTSLLPYGGGVIVLQAPHTLFLKDTNGDGVADERKILFTGWGTGDTHAGPSNLRYGPDNWIWGIVGYSGYDGTVGGERHNFRQGFFRFKPDGSKLEFIRSVNNNCWGVGFSEEGLLFGSTANGCPSVFAPIANRYYEKVRGWSASVLGSIADSNRYYPVTDKVRQVDFHGGFTAAAGHALYTARAYPKEYWNRTAFVTEPTGHLAATFVLEKHGSEYRAKNSWNLVASDDEWAAPIMAEVGPDGCVWVLDWYNYIVQHNPTPPGFRTGRGNAYETELRDKTHGRIYRLIPKDLKATPLTLKDATPDQLVATLKNDNMFWRLTAQRRLVERGQKDVVPALSKLLEDQSVDETGLNGAALHALWTWQGLGGVAVDDLVLPLHHKSAAVRRAAVLALPRTQAGLTALLGAGVLQDADPQVRLGALLALSEMPASQQAAEAVLVAISTAANLNDRWLLDAVTVAAAAHDAHFLKAIAKTQVDSGRLLDITSRVAEHLGRSGSPGAAELVVALAKGDPKLAEVILTALAKGWSKNRKIEANDETRKAIGDLFAKLSTSGRGQLLTLTKAWGVKGLEQHAAQINASLLKVLTDEKASEPERLGAARDLIDLQPQDEKIVTTLLEQVTPRTTPGFASSLIEAVGQSQATVGPMLLERFKELSPAPRLAIIRVLLRRPASTAYLLEAIEKNQIPLNDLSLDQRQALASHPDKKLADQAKKLLDRGGALPSADRAKVLAQFAAAAHQKGDAVKGKKLFLDQCSKCHRHGSDGHQIGPDLTGMAVHPKEHLLMEIIDPSRSVEGNFRAYTIATVDGQILNGLLLAESKTAIELVDVEAKKHVVLREDIDRMQISAKSLMPEGFEKQLKEEDFANLLEFLTQRGKYLPLPVNKAATVVSTKGMFNSEESTAERLVLPDWKPRTVEGVPFQLVDPVGERVPNVILLNGPQGTIPPRMPKSVMLPCNAPAKAVHILGGVSGWGFPGGQRGSVSVIVRLHYQDGKTEDHELKNGIHLADYIRRVDVPESKFAFRMRDQQMRYLAIQPARSEPIKQIELVKGNDRSAPVVLAITVELP
jgi:putative membrane-bound dehydrogenase-like protein